MDNSRITSPPSTHVYDLNPQHGTHIPTSRPLMHASRSSATSSGPMPIPNVKFVPPPPLPPPRNPGVAAGSDLALQWANNVHHHGSGGTGSVVAGSSLLGGYNRGMKQEDSGHDGPGSFRRGSSSLTIQSDMLPDTQAKYDRFRNQDEGYHSLSGSSLTNQMSVSFGSLPVLLACVRMAWATPMAAIWPCLRHVAALLDCIQHCNSWALVINGCLQ